MFWLRLSGWLFVLIVVATAVVMILGSRLRAEHTETLTAVVHASPASLWPLLIQADLQARWRSDVSSAEPLPDDGGLPCWLERHNRQAIPVCVVESTAPRHLVLRTADPRLPFHVIRSVELASDPATPLLTRVSVIDTVSIAPPMLRFYEHHVSGDRTRAEHLLADLDRATSSPAIPGRAAP